MIRRLEDRTIEYLPASQREDYGHRALRRLLRTALHRVAEARALLRDEDAFGAGLAVGKAINLIGGVRDALVLEDEVLAAEFDELCGYLERRLVAANRGRDPIALDEVRATLEPIADAWDEATARHLAGVGRAADLVDRTSLRMGRGAA
ncbi:MAG: flagellar export chaperone FliS [Pseudomonadales bacterium]|jgi:flagellar protein FliS|nr:flagellar export chaperone FliS [Pseudomonadales bacterium]